MKKDERAHLGGRVRAQLGLVLTAVSLRLLACAADAGSMASDNESAPPDNATLCKLKPGKTTIDEAKAILGKPYVETGSNGLGYVYTAAALNLSFVDGVLARPVVGGSLESPDCWSSK